MYKKKYQIIALGNFDLIHKGHKAVYENADIVLLFKNIPKKLNNVYSDKERKDFFKSIGKKVFFYNLKNKNKNLSAISFYKKYISKYQKIFVGNNYVFGKDQILINDFIKKYEINNIYPIKLKSLCSSSKIKEYLKVGNIQLANKLLINPFFINGKVQIGNKIGRTIGYRTINFYFKKSVPIIPYGVYISKTIIKNKSYFSITFWGNSKFSKNNFPKMETHIINFSKNIYWKKVKVEFYKKIADVKTFNNLDELKQAISMYVNNANDFFKKNNNLK